MKKALVLSGGGARGAYQIGAIKALNELNIKCDIVTGTSIGSINAALYATDNTENALKLWKSISFNTVFKENIINKEKPLKEYIKSTKSGGLNPENLKNILKEIIDIDKLYNSNINYGLVTTTYPKLKTLELTKDDIKKEELIDYIMASATVYPVFKLQTINDESFVDGGVKKPVPFTLAEKMGATSFIIINISLFGTKFKVPKGCDAIIIKPKNNIGSVLKFNSYTAKRNIKYGYNDTMKAYKKLYGNKYTFKDIYNYYNKDDIFKNKTEFLNTIEYLGKTFNINDTKIYTINIYNDLLLKEIKNININNVKFKDLLNNKDRIIYILERIKNNKRIIIKNIRKNYLAAYYIYNYIINNK